MTPGGVAAAVRPANVTMEFTPQAVLYQAVLFVALYVALKRLVFDRLLANLQARHDRTRGALEEAAKLREQVAALRVDYATQMAELGRQAALAKEEIRRQAEASEREILEAARSEAARSLATARARMADEVRAAQASLENEVAQLSERVLDRLFERAR
jgi:F-type H+-transporting ATPase subunit b